VRRIRDKFVEIGPERHVTHFPGLAVTTTKSLMTPITDLPGRGARIRTVRNRLRWRPQDFRSRRRHQGKTSASVSGSDFD